MTSWCGRAGASTLVSHSAKPAKQRNPLLADLPGTQAPEPSLNPERFNKWLPRDTYMVEGGLWNSARSG